MENLSDLLKYMLGDQRVCTVCGCTLLIDKTFHTECFSCDAIMWKSLTKEDGHGRRSEDSGGRTEEATEALYANAEER